MSAGTSRILTVLKFKIWARLHHKWVQRVVVNHTNAILTHSMTIVLKASPIVTVQYATLSSPKRRMASRRLIHRRIPTPYKPKTPFTPEHAAHAVPLPASLIRRRRAKHLGYAGSSSASETPAHISRRHRRNGDEIDGPLHGAESHNPKARIGVRRRLFQLPRWKARIN